MAMDNEKTETHPSYGLVQFSRVSGGSGTMFGTSVRSNNYIRLRISPARVHKNFYREWYMSERQDYIEVDLSNNQFAELLTQMNMGDGVPCTIRRLNGEQIPEPPVCKALTQQVHSDFEDEMKKKATTINDAAKALSAELDNSKVSAATKNQLKSLLNQVVMEFNSNIPFALDQFTEASEEVVVQAKAEIEGFMVNAIQKAGMEAITSGKAIIDVPSLNPGLDTDLTGVK
jgi:hypothetical protein